MANSTTHVASAPLAQHRHGQIEGRSTGERGLWTAILRGSLLRCPACGDGKMFSSYLKVGDHCSDCGEALHHHRADDAPPYFAITIIGHVVVSLLLAVEMAYRPPLWVHSALWIPLTIILCLATLPSIKGALVGLQWGLLMHGFDPNHDEDSPYEDPAERVADFGAGRT